MAHVITVSFRLASRPYYFDPVSLNLAPGDHVVAETTKGLEVGRVVKARHFVPDRQVPKPLRKVIRQAEEADLRTEEENRGREAEAWEQCSRLVREHKLPMRLINVAYTLDRARVVFYFSAEGRIDFRNLVRDLARVLKTRIEMHQVGVRDQAKMVGGYGGCGRPLCCATFLNEFSPVAIKMAKEQGLSLSPSKISGMCGRLLCCLRYEYDTYRDLRKSCPRPGTTVETPDGPAQVVDVELLKGRVVVEFAPEDEEDEAGERGEYDVDELKKPEPPPPRKRPRRDRRRRRRPRGAKGEGGPEGGEKPRESSAEPPRRQSGGSQRAET